MRSPRPRLTCEEALAIVQKAKGRSWGVQWDPLAVPTPPNLDREEPDRCQVVNDHDGHGSCNVVGQGPTWETALEDAGIPW